MNKGNVVRSLATGLCLTALMGASLKANPVVDRETLTKVAEMCAFLAPESDWKTEALVAGIAAGTALITEQPTRAGEEPAAVDIAARAAMIAGVKRGMKVLDAGTHVAGVVGDNAYIKFACDQMLPVVAYIAVKTGIYDKFVRPQVQKALATPPTA